MVITRPNHDPTTTYLHCWSQAVIDTAKKHAISIVDIRAKRVTKKIVMGIIDKTKPSFIFFNGHGNAGTICGYDNEPLIEFNSNESVLKNAIVFARACQSASELGPSCVAKGTKTYLGYTDDFIFL